MELDRSFGLDRDEVGFLAVSAIAVTVIAQLSDPGSIADLLIVSPAVLAFVVQGRLRRLPAELFAALVVVPIVIVVGKRLVLEPMLFLTVTMVLYLSAELRSTARAAAIAVVAGITPWVIARWLAPEDMIGWPPWVLAHAFTFVLGRLIYRYKQLIVQLDEAREALAEQAVAEERRRIARELHDLAGHTLAAMLLHVTGARHVLRRDLDDAEQALVDAESVGRTSLDQIRATVAALRTDERGTDPALAGSADLDALIDEYRRTGMEITASIASPVAQLDGPVGTALHRITREALANVARHAAGNRVEVFAGLDDYAVKLTVTDHGRAAAAPDPHRAHFGLVGMSERARALGGTLDARGTVDGWRVDARLPILAAPTNELARS